ncbi:hypothetical protein [Methylocapsa aurea]|uniref:hypothetical protein n=1 Tax=Methylocapsa aurea TaxID=663610 RepID=UPI00056856AA|nr:hypothetical protein [Methylocapsa aurea]
MKNALISTCAASALVALGMSAGMIQPAAAQLGEVTGVDAVAILGTVVSVDKTTRNVTLKGPNDNVFVVHAGDEVRNLPQVKSGDVVTLSYRAAILTELRKARHHVKPSVTVDDAVARAKLGDKPAAENVRLVTIVGEIVHIDPAENALVIEGPLGERHKVKLQKDDQKKLLGTLKVGELVEGAYMEAITLAVSAPDAPAPEPKAATKPPAAPAAK